MKTILIITALTALIWGYQSEFCAGWKDGYQDGYCYEKVGCAAPPAPICPIPEVGFTKYKHGYAKGFLKGKNDGGR